MRGYFITGTDTEVGKTRVSAALLHSISGQGLRSAGLKPVAAGMECVDGIWVNEDVRALRDASSVALSDAEVGPFQFKEACAPHIAAALQGRDIERKKILLAAHTLSKRADVLVVEGVGGFCVPLGLDWDSSDLAVDLNLPVILVVGLRLGCINHALLTAQAVRSRGLRLAGWIGNALTNDMPWRDENIATLNRHLLAYGAQCLGLVPHLAPPSPSAISAYLDTTTLLTKFFDPGAQSPGSN